eukprot:2416907-Pyramimonas_sp.AAC.1
MRTRDQTYAHVTENACASAQSEVTKATAVVFTKGFSPGCSLQTAYRVWSLLRTDAIARVGCEGEEGRVAQALVRPLHQLRDLLKVKLEWSSCANSGKGALNTPEITMPIVYHMLT